MQVEVVRHHHGPYHRYRRRELSPRQRRDEEPPGDLGGLGPGDRGEGREGGALYIFFFIFFSFFLVGRRRRRRKKEKAPNSLSPSSLFSLSLSLSNTTHHRPYE